MKVLLRRNVSKLGRIGDVVDARPGYARNYLLPQRIAVEPSEANLKTVEAEKQQYLQKLAKEREEIQARAALVHGKEITLPTRANVEGRLYGSVGPAQISASLAEEGVFIDPEDIRLESPIRQLDKYDVLIQFAEDITATIHVWVVPVHEPGEQPDEGTPSAEQAWTQDTQDEDAEAEAPAEEG